MNEIALIVNGRAETDQKPESIDVIADEVAGIRFGPLGQRALLQNNLKSIRSFIKLKQKTKERLIRESQSNEDFFSKLDTAMDE